MTPDMGNQLIRMVEAKAMAGTMPPIGNAARVCLWAIAMNAHDTGANEAPAGCYYRGWDHLARCLGYDGLTPSGKSAVARALAELQAADLIKRDDSFRNPRRPMVTTYRLTL